MACIKVSMSNAKPCADMGVEVPEKGPATLCDAMTVYQNTITNNHYGSDRFEEIADGVIRCMKDNRGLSYTTKEIMDLIDQCGEGATEQEIRTFREVAVNYVD